MKLETEAKLLRLKSTMNKVQDSSFAYSRIYQKYPMHTLDEEKATQFIKVIEDILADLQNELKKYENKNSSYKNMEG